MTYRWMDRHDLPHHVLILYIVYIECIQTIIEFFVLCICHHQINSVKGDFLLHFVYFLCKELWAKISSGLLMPVIML